MLRLYPQLWLYLHMGVFGEVRLNGIVSRVPMPQVWLLVMERKDVGSQCVEERLCRDHVGRSHLESMTKGLLPRSQWCYAVITAWTNQSTASRAGLGDRARRIDLAESAREGRGAGACVCFRSHCVTEPLWAKVCMHGLRVVTGRDVTKIKFLWFLKEWKRCLAQSTQCG